jgi:CheY-like chemotaxis protein
MSPKTILIVDDNVEVLESLRDVFEEEGYAVLCAANGAEGLQVLQKSEPPSLVLLDLSMPLMSGDELYEVMKTDPRLAHVPVLISTSDPSQAPGDVLTLRKPIDLWTLLRIVEQHCGPPNTGKREK